ncbi:putative ABC transport system permease protein [Micromonospora luteifusca]|uniref:ABC transport system permease protein n=1 Tax=Micromonospora luteifusca TaxID=709860 RepID=A0ABS2LMC1_9ACTN|nr:FtsX-like permease family protein [Micromonospora luteifusca]MBM7489330.1 putative ABC transport system permease protein [Micromonospora luteifusca]
MSALARVVRAGVGRRRVQTIVVGLVVMIAVTSAVLGGSLMVASQGPFDRAFSQQQGAHLTAQFNAAAVTEAQLTATASAAGVAASAGPFPNAQLNLISATGDPIPPVNVVGRADAGGAVDRVSLVEGRWATAPGEIVLATGGRMQLPPQMVGRQWTVSDAPGSRAVTVVGVARSASRTADAWTTPAQLAAWAGPDGPRTYQMLYRFTTAGTAEQVQAGRTAVEATVPAAAFASAVSWLDVRRDATGETLLLVPFLIAFGMLGVVMAVLIIGNVIAGAVSTATRRIGILKALGFTPAQVVRAYVGQALIPATVGAALGVVAGNLLTVPILAQTNQLYGTNDNGVALWVDAVVVGGALTIVAVTALAASARAGRLRSVDALAVGRTPRPGRGQWAARLTSRLPISRPVTLGLAHPFARPVRAVSIVAAIAFGAAAVTFAVGLGTSLNRVQEVEDIADVQVGAPHRMAPGEQPPPGPGKPQPFDDPAAIEKVIAAQAGTGGYMGVARSEVTASGITGELDAVAVTGPDSARYYRMVSGTWLTGPGQIVVSTPFLTAAGKRVGDSIVLTDSGVDTTVTIVGEAFNTDNDGMQVVTDIATLRAAEPELAPSMYYVSVESGTDVGTYAEALTTALEPVGAAADRLNHQPDGMIIIVNALTGLLSLMLMVVAGLGVLNTVVLETRERVHDLGVHKALGMTPRQTTAMVIASVVVTGLLGGAVGAAVGVWLQRTVITEMAGSVGFRLPDSVLDVYGSVDLLFFGLAGLVIAVVGALLPAGWAAKTRVAVALRTE